MSPELAGTHRHIGEVAEQAVHAEREELLVLPLRIASVLRGEERAVAPEGPRVDQEPGAVGIVDERGGGRSRPPGPVGTIIRLSGPMPSA